MEADFLRYYRLNLWADLTTERLPWCRFAALVESLPWDSAYARSAAAGTNGPPPELLLLASMLDHQRGQAWANADPKSRGARPASVVAALRPNTDGDRYSGLADRLRRIREQHDAEEV